MNLIELKEAIRAHNVPSDLIIFVCDENYFLADQYVDAICIENQKSKTPINSLYELDSALSLVVDSTDNLSVLKTEIFDEVLEDYSNLENVIIICKKIDKKIKDIVEPYIIKIDKLVDWQIKAYIKALAPVLDEPDIDWLYKACNKDIYRISNELDKILLFDRDQQLEVLNRIKYEPDSDLCTINIFDLTDAILFNNKIVLLDYLAHKKSCDIAPLALVGSVLTKAKNLLFVNYNSGKSKEVLGLNEGYYKILTSRTFKAISQARLQSLISFLSTIDLKLKSGLWDIPEEQQIDYIISYTII